MKPTAVIHGRHQLGGTLCSVFKSLPTDITTANPEEVTCKRCQQVLARLDREAKQRMLSKSSSD
jgi:hypothetical protein